MSDTERLDLVEHYGWSVRCIAGKWHVTITPTIIIKDSLREAIDGALSAQIKWSLGR